MNSDKHINYFSYLKPLYLSSFVLLYSITLLSGCGKKQEPKTKPVMPYKVIKVQKANTTIYAEYPTTLQGIVDIEVRPKIDGYIEQIYVEEGQEVTKGQLLFKISNPQYTQDLESLAAAVESAQTNIKTAEVQVERLKPLVEQKIISAFELQNAELALQARKSDLTQAQARYANAQTNIGYTLIKSPVNGIVGTIPYKLGSYVNSATGALTRISDIHKIYAYFSVNEKKQLDIMSRYPGASFSEKIKHIPAVNLILSNGESYDKQGKIETFSGQANTLTGSFNVRAGFANPNKMLRSGNSGIIQIPAYLENVILIPQKATMELQDKRLALVVDSNKVKAVPIQVRAVSGGQYYVVDEGLKPDDQLIIEGVGILTEGTPIIPQIVSTDSVLNLKK